METTSASAGSVGPLRGSRSGFLEHLAQPLAEVNGSGQASVRGPQG